ncbi:MAG: T9SS type A sorting domain-containing protein [Bacteroidetes bacterium]|nr:T9SS type A sorting domain-containing protein [Bacteroidota bacterium]
MKQFLTFLSFLFITNVNAQWSYIKEMPKALSKHTATLYNGKIYVFGDKYTFLYDPSINTWKTIDTVTKIGEYKTAVTLLDKIYITGDDITLIFNPSNNDWDTLKPPIPKNFRRNCAVALNNKLYVMGGDSGLYFSNSFLEFDPAQNKWNYKEKMITARRLPSASTANGKIYVSGGFANDVLSAFEVYNPLSKQWDLIQQLPSRRYQHVQGKIMLNGNEKIFIAGGYNDNELIDFHIYDPLSEKWFEMKDMNEYRYRFCAVSIDNCIYVFGGFNSSGTDRATAEKICINSLSIKPENFKKSNLIYPNPSNGVININITESDFLFEVFDIYSHKIIYKNSINKKIENLPLASGLYYYRLKTNNNFYNGKLIIN